MPAADTALAVLTAKSKDELLQRGRSGTWTLDRVKARKCEWLVCCRNAHNRETAGSEPHGTAFMVARISDVTAADKEGRWHVEFDKYALIDLPDTWSKTGPSRNPIRYTTLGALGIQADDLDLKPVETRPRSSAPKLKFLGALAKSGSATRGDTVEYRPLTLAQAKIGLAQALGVEPDSIEITIRY